MAACHASHAAGLAGNKGIVACLPSELSKQPPPEAGGERLGGGYLANVAVSEFEQHFAALPESLSGAAFLERHPEGTGDTVTTIDPEKTYAVRQPTRHPVYEHFRVKAFAELLHGTPVATGPFGRQVERCPARRTR